MTYDEEEVSVEYESDRQGDTCNKWPVDLGDLEVLTIGSELSHA
jgi:hypothetical protein